MPNRSRPLDGFEGLIDRLSRHLETVSKSLERTVHDRYDDHDSAVSMTNLDLADRGDSLLVTVDVPGFDSNEIDIRLTGETIHISGERETIIDDEDGDDRYIRRERRSQSFERSVRLPDPVDHDTVDASLHNGVLSIELEKVEPDEGKTIDIE